MTMIWFSLIFHKSNDRDKKIHKDNSYVPSFSCLKGARIRVENDNNLCDHHHSIFHRNDNNEKIKYTKMRTMCRHLHVWEESKQEVKTMIITNHHLLFFIGTTTKREKKHEVDNYMLLFWCLKGVGIKGEDNNDFCDHRHLLFFKGTMSRRKKTMKTTFVCHHLCV
jgi:hypothetical protein